MIICGKIIPVSGIAIAGMSGPFEGKQEASGIGTK